MKDVLNCLAVNPHSMVVIFLEEFVKLTKIVREQET